VINILKPILQLEPKTLEETVALVKGISENRTLKAIQWLVEHGKIVVNDEQLLFWKKR